jgi:hypothetical protein
MQYAAEDDLARDKMAQELQIAASKTRVDEQKIRLEQDKVRAAPYSAPTTEPVTVPNV